MTTPGSSSDMPEVKKALVIGVGPEKGLGASISARFAREGFHVFVAGRTAQSLEKVVRHIEEAGGMATAVVADATREADVQALFDQVCAASGRLEVAVYNTGNNTPGAITEMEASYFEQAWRVCCFGGFLFGREAARRMLPGGGTLLFTGASASLRGRAGFAAFNSAKAGLRNLAQAMAKELGPKGLHVGHVVVDGGIDGDKLRKGRPEVAQRMGEERLIDLGGLAEAYWFLHQQPPRAWTFELDLRSKVEPW
ncbi:MAG: SDR family NAD(P)-dependent oxidoreductase [Burkholderiales bacterium]|jgi:NAD(P)-dependent dehydrogenase (short-subunit alcohol dehydrogenase family)